MYNYIFIYTVIFILIYIYTLYIYTYLHMLNFWIAGYTLLLFDLATENGWELLNMVSFHSYVKVPEGNAQSHEHRISNRHQHHSFRQRRLEPWTAKWGKWSDVSGGTRTTVRFHVVLDWSICPYTPPKHDMEPSKIAISASTRKITFGCPFFQVLCYIYIGGEGPVACRSIPAIPDQHFRGLCLKVWYAVLLSCPFGRPRIIEISTFACGVFGSHFVFSVLPPSAIIDSFCHVLS